MILALKLGLLCLLVSFEALAFPRVNDWQNKPVVVFENKKEAVLKKEMLLKWPFAVVTSANDKLSLRLNSVDDVFVYPETKLQILDLTEDAGFVDDLYLIDGSIRYTAGFRGVDKKAEVITLHTAFFALKVAQTSDFVITLDMKVPSVQIKVIKGALPVEFFAYEKKLNLKAGESATFKGELADDKASIRYDFLLNERKAPRGKLLETEKFDPAGFLESEKKANEQMAQAKKAAKARLEAARLKQKAYEDSFLCKKPFGHLNQCNWAFEANKCYRKRCNANGQWGDVTERPMDGLGTVCKKEVFVGECDY
jgi:hypothetical protein